MFYIGIKSGLGNQMFQYAYGYAAAKKTGLSAALDIRSYERQFAKDTPRAFGLQHFNISIPVAAADETAKFYTPLWFFLRRIANKLFPPQNYEFDPRQFDIKDGELRMGYWQNAKYFEEYADDIRREFTLREEFGSEAMAAINEIESLKSKGVATLLVHVRRGDYVSNPHAAAAHGTASAEYFKSGIRLVRERINLADSNEEGGAPLHVFFATEDMDWVRENIIKGFLIDIPHAFITRPGIKDYEELLVMSHCDHFVISNSSFSWWAAWLAANPHKIIVAPKRWRVDPKENTEDATPSNWLRI